MNSRGNSQRAGTTSVSRCSRKTHGGSVWFLAVACVAATLTVLTGSWAPADAVSSHLLIAPSGEEEYDNGNFGSAIASAGDFNDDGYADIIVGDAAADYYAGAAYIYHGGPGADDVADMVLQPEEGIGDFGRIVASAGDFNHDGYPDVIVRDTNWFTEYNHAYLYFGGAEADNVADLEFSGHQASEDFGAAMASAGDFNGDGYSDLAIGAPHYSITGIHTGRVYLYYGGPGADVIADLTFSIEYGDSLLFGSSLAFAPDFNGDGFDDLVVGAPSERTQYNGHGRAYLYLGGSEPDTLLDTYLNWWEVQHMDKLGASLAGAGDLNGDGYDDIVVGAPYRQIDDHENCGQVTVYFGNPGAMGEADFVLTGEPEDYLGYRVAAAGDVNADGFADFMVTVPLAETPGGIGPDWGVTRLYLGGTTLSETPDLVFAPEFGISVGSIAPAGDFDGDGFDDLLMGNVEHAEYRGRAYVYAIQPLQLLSPSGGDLWVTGEEATIHWRGAEPADLTLSLDGGFTWETIAEDLGGARENGFALTVPGQPTTSALAAICPRGEGPEHRFAAQSATSFRIVALLDPPCVTDELQHRNLGEASGDMLGTSVSPAGDFNGDGYEDYIVGAPHADGGGDLLGCAYLHYGGPGTDGEPDLTFTGESSGSMFGVSVAAAGDVNGDGFDDVVVGASEESAFMTMGGAAYIFFGGLSPDPLPDLTLWGMENFEYFGLVVSCAGDINRDSYDDVLVGACYSDAGGNNVGRAYVFHGGRAADSSPDWMLTGEDDGDFFGYAVAGLGDINRDGYGDVAIGAPNNSDLGHHAGRCYIYWGGAEADDIADLVLTGEAAGDRFGISVAAAGDVSGDGVPDLIVGAHEHDQPHEDLGAAYLFFGGRFMNPVCDLKLHGEASDDAFGWAVASAGDVNMDGCDDIIVGANLNDAGAFDAGRAYVFFGGPGADGTPDITFTGENYDDGFGKAIAGAGDVSGDGFPDILIGAPGYNAAGSDDGAAYLYDIDRYRLDAPVGGDTWNVGATYPVAWHGAQPADVWLSVDGGASYMLLESQVGGHASNSLDLTVPHQPTRYARLLLTCSDTGVFGEACSDSFFTIDAAIELIEFRAAPAPDADEGVLLSWNTDPGPEDLKGYRIARKSGGDWETLAPLTRETSFVDRQASQRAEYQLYAINGLDEEMFLGNTAIGPTAALDAWPRLYRRGALNISFATSSGLGGTADRATVKLYDTSGRLVRTVIDGKFSAGTQNATWDGRDDSGRPVQGGVYFLRSSSGNHQNTLRLLVVR